MMETAIFVGEIDGNCHSKQNYFWQIRVDATTIWWAQDDPTGSPESSEVKTVIKPWLVTRLQNGGCRKYVSLCENMIKYVSLSCFQMQGYPYPQHMEYGDF